MSIGSERLAAVDDVAPVDDVAAFLIL